MSLQNRKTSIYVAITVGFLLALVLTTGADMRLDSLAGPAVKGESATTANR